MKAQRLTLVTVLLFSLVGPAWADDIRITFRGENTESFHRVGSRFVIASAIPLAAGITGGLYVAVTKALDSAAAGAVLAIAIAALLIMLWFIRPLMHRKSIGGAGHG